MTGDVINAVPILDKRIDAAFTAGWLLELVQVGGDLLGEDVREVIGRQADPRGDVIDARRSGLLELEDAHRQADARIDATSIERRIVGDHGPL